MFVFDKDCIILNATVASPKEVILLLAGFLAKKGLVSDKFGMAAFEREQSFPTGVPASPFSFAFPHADGTKVYQSSLAVATLAQPLLFHSMEDPRVELKVRAVFLTASRTPKDQVNVLKRFSSFFKKEGNLLTLSQFTDPAGLAAWMQEQIISKIR